MERLSKSEIIFKVIAYTLIGIFAILALYPIIYAFSVSISDKAYYETGQIVLWPKGITFLAYDKIINSKSFWIAYSNTIFYTFFGTIFSMVVSVAGAYVLAKDRLMGKRVWNFLLVFTMWFSAGIIPKYINYVSMGADSRWGMIFAFGITAYNIILLRNAFAAIPSEIEEAAIIDGANEFQILTKIFIPMSGATLATVTLFYAIARWNEFYWGKILLEDIDSPLQVFLRKFIEEYRTEYEDTATVLPYAADSLAYAIIMCSIVPVLVIYPYIQKYFAKGVNLGGVKG